jgi:hypothetical protein
VLLENKISEFNPLSILNKNKKKSSQQLIKISSTIFENGVDRKNIVP